jgi:CRP/FNR family transcriptional regulator, cyclic AMP receptor protein
MDPKQAAIKGVPLFATCSKKEIALIATLADRFTLQPGEDLIREGKLGSDFYIIMGGTAEVRKGDVVLATLGPGDFCGEIASLEKVRRTATVTAITQIDALVLRSSALSGLRERLPNLDQAVLDEMNSRLSADAARD